MYCRMFHGISGLYSLDPIVLTTKNASRHRQMSAEGQNDPEFRITGPRNSQASLQNFPIVMLPQCCVSISS